MSFFLDPPALFLLGMFVYYVEKRFRWSRSTTILNGAVIAVVMFMGGSSLLYMDVIDWPMPSTEGPVWMFHTNYTGIEKAEFPVIYVVFLLLLYPLWHLLGYVVAQRMDVGSFLLKMVSYGDVKSQRERRDTKFVVRRGPFPRQMTREAIEALGGMGKFVKNGDRVLIKPNICGGNPLTPGSYTSIEIIDEIVDMVLGLDAEPVVIDSDMIWTKFGPVAEAQGWTEWAERKGVKLTNLANTEKARFNFGKDSAIGIVPVSMELVEADVIISVPTMKTHLLTSVTIAMKNMYGTFPEENKAKYHRLGIENVVYEVNNAFTPNLTIVDGTVGGEAWGPLSCNPVNFETIVASNDVVAADAVACRLMGYDPMDIVHIKKAHEEGLGDASAHFNLGSLPYGKEKDGSWEKPDPSVSVFYEGLVEAALLLPGMQAFFDIAADFVLYGMATIPILRDLTPQVERVINDILAGLLRSGNKGTKLGDEDLEKLQDTLRENC
ncbi:MAG: DUF362 domain-containing protein [Candidatus Bathyarchaeota archaeon]|nr:MAG: DUF362 domain-containing protein [Candidatus Bathyarchaeota archaeon]